MSLLDEEPVGGKKDESSLSEYEKILKKRAERIAKEQAVSPSIEEGDERGLGSQFVEGGKEFVKSMAEGAAMLTDPQGQEIIQREIDEPLRGEEGPGELNAMIRRAREQRAATESPEMAEKRKAAIEAVPSYHEIATDISKIQALEADPSLQQDLTFMEKVVRTSAQVLGQSIIHVATGGTLSIPAMGLSIAGTSYKNSIAEGATHENARNMALLNAVIQAPIEKLAIGKATKWFKPKMRLVKRIKEISQSAAAEGLTELIQEYPDSWTNLMAVNPDENKLKQLAKVIVSGKVLLEALESGAIGAILGGGMSTVGVAVNSIRNPQEAIEDIAEMDAAAAFDRQEAQKNADALVDKSLEQQGFTKEAVTTLKEEPKKFELARRKGKKLVTPEKIEEIKKEKKIVQKIITFSEDEQKAELIKRGFSEEFLNVMSKTDMAATLREPASQSVIDGAPSRPADEVTPGPAEITVDIDPATGQTVVLPDGSPTAPPADVAPTTPLQRQDVVEPATGQEVITPDVVKLLEPIALQDVNPDAKIIAKNWIQQYNKQEAERGGSQMEEPKSIPKVTKPKVKKTKVTPVVKPKAKPKVLKKLAVEKKKVEPAKVVAPKPKVLAKPEKIEEKPRASAPRVKIDTKSLEKAYKKAMQAQPMAGTHVEISEVQKRLGVPMEEFKEYLKEESREGRVILSLGDWSVSNEEVRKGAIEIYGRPQLLVKFKEFRPEEKKPSPKKRLPKAKREAKIKEASLKLAGGEYEKRVHLKDIRKEVPDVSLEDFDNAMLRMQNEGELVLMNLNDPRERTPEDKEAAIDILGKKRHIVYMKEPKPKKKTRVVKAKTGKIVTPKVTKPKKKRTKVVTEPVKKPTKLREKLPLTATKGHPKFVEDITKLNPVQAKNEMTVIRGLLHRPDITEEIEDRYQMLVENEASRTAKQDVTGRTSVVTSKEEREETLFQAVKSGKFTEGHEAKINAVAFDKKGKPKKNIMSIAKKLATRDIQPDELFNEAYLRAKYQLATGSQNMSATHLGRYMQQFLEEDQVVTIPKAATREGEGKAVRGLSEQELTEATMESSGRRSEGKAVIDEPEVEKKIPVKKRKKKTSPVIARKKAGKVEIIDGTLVEHTKEATKKMAKMGVPEKTQKIVKDAVETDHPQTPIKKKIAKIEEIITPAPVKPKNAKQREVLSQLKEEMSEAIQEDPVTQKTRRVTNKMAMVDVKNILNGYDLSYISEETKRDVRKAFSPLKNQKGGAEIDLGPAAKKMKKGAKKLAMIFDVESWFESNEKPVALAIKNHKGHQATEQFYALRDTQSMEDVVQAAQPNMSREDQTEALLAYENEKIIYAQLSDEKKKLYDPIIEQLHAYFGGMQKELKTIGQDLDYVKHSLKALQEEHDTAETQGERDSIKEEMAVLKQMNFASIPVALLYTKISRKSRRGSGGGKKKAKAMINIFNDMSRKRETLSIENLLKHKLFKGVTLTPSEVVGMYGYRAAKDFALARVIEEMAKAGLVLKKGKNKKAPAPTGYRKASVFKWPALSDYYISNRGMDVLENLVKLETTRNPYDYLNNRIKALQFFNFLFMPIYDILQGVKSGQWRGTSPKHMKEAWLDVSRKSDEFLEAQELGLFSKPFELFQDEYIMKLVKIGAHGRIPGISSIVEAAQIRGKSTPGKIYHGAEQMIMGASWNIAWDLDNKIRMVTYKGLVSRGMSKSDAAQMAAKIHGDYASVPPKTRKWLNRVIFTPTFKIVMHKMYYESIKSSLNVATKAMTGKLGEASKVEKAMALNAMTIAATGAAFHMILKSLGFELEDDDWFNYGRSYTHKDWFPDLRIVLSTPHNIDLRYLGKIAKANRATYGDFLSIDFLERVFGSDSAILPKIAMDIYENRTFDGSPIYDEFDSRIVQSAKSIGYGLLQSAAIINTAYRGVKMTGHAKSMALSSKYSQRRTEELQKLGEGWAAIIETMSPVYFGYKTPEEHKIFKAMKRNFSKYLGDMKKSVEQGKEVNDSWTEEFERRNELLMDRMDKASK